MSGKQRQAQRTKNNARPSSSSRSAEKLGVNLPSFIGFSADRDGGYVTVLPGFSTNENIDPNLDPTIQVIFRKMCKKDPTTKLKALNEFTALINFSDEATVCTTLSFWPKLYSQLSADCNHRVREAAQIAHFALVSKCGRSIAPYLKQIIPVWIASQYDIYMPAKSQAKESFDKMFPSQKVPEVMMFCRKEIMNFVYDNLILHTPTTLSNAKIYSQEECEAIYERTIVMTLQAYELFIDNLVEEHLEWLCDYQTKLLDNNKFWGLEKHKSPLIRSSLYGVIGCLCRKVTEWFSSKYGEKAVTMLLSKLCEKDADVITSVLENSILIMAYIKDCWDKIDFGPKILTNIFNILSEGGYNNATRIAPLLAPLLKQLSNIPNKDEDLYNNFFNAICKGLEQRCVFSSKGAYDAWLLGLVECLKYFANANIKMENGAQALSQPIRSWITATLCPKIPNSSFNYKKISAFYIADVSVTWTNESVSIDSNKNTFFSHVVRLFWKNIHFVISSQLENVKPEEEEIKNVTDVHVEFLAGLKSVHNIKRRKSINVKFNIDQDSEKKNENAHSTKSDITTTSQNYQNGLNSVVYDTCATYLSYAKNNNLSSPILTPLFSLISEFNTPRLHEAMYHAVIKKEQNVNKIVSLYDDCYAGWLSGDSMRSSVVVDLIFTLMTHLNYDEQSHILKSFDQLPLPVIKWCISRCIAHPYSSYPAIAAWLHTNTVHQSLLALSKLVVKEGDKNYLELLKMCFVQSDSDGMLISKSTMTEIAGIFEQSLYKYVSDHLDMCALFVTNLLAVSDLQNPENQEIYCKLLIGLIKLDWYLQHMPSLPDDSILEINTSWRDAISTIYPENLLYFTERISPILHDKLLDGKIDLKNANILVNITIQLMHACIDVIEDSKPDILNNILTSLLTNDSNDVKSDMYNITSLSVLAEVLNGKFSCALLSDIPMLKELIDKNENGSIPSKFYKILSWLLFKTAVMKQIAPILQAHIEIIQLSDDENITATALESGFKNNLHEILYNFTVLQTLFSEYKMCTAFSQIESFYHDVEQGVMSIFGDISTPIYDDVYNTLKQKSDTEGLYWAKCIHVLDFKLNRNKEYLTEKLFESKVVKLVQSLVEYNDLDVLFGNRFYHNFQLLIYEMDSIDFDDIDLKLKIAGIISIRHIYSRYSICGEESKLKLTIDDLLKALPAPINYLPIITDVHFLHKNLMLYDTDISKSDWNMVYCNSAIVKFLSLCVRKSGWDLKFDEWDFIMITLSSLINSLNISKNSWETLKVSTLSCAVFELYSTVIKFVSTILPESVRREPSEIIVHLLDEWRELFSPEIHKHLTEIFIAVSSNCIASRLVLTSSTIFFIKSFSEAMQEFDLKYLESTTAKSSGHTSVNIMQKCLDIMASTNHHILKFMSSNILKLLTPSLINSDKAEGDKSNASGDDPAPEPIVLSVHTIEPTLIYLQGCVEGILDQYKVGLNYCVLLPHKDSHSIILGYLLIWEVLLDIAQESTAYLQHEYSEFFRQGEYVDQLLKVLFRLLPEELAEQSSSIITSKYFKSSLKSFQTDPLTSNSISGLACQSLLKCLQGGWLGALVRNWWGSLPTRTSQFVEQIVRTHVSPILISNQISGVIKNQSKIPNIEISIHNSVNEIVCIYVIEDLKMGLTIQLCNNHPLNKPNVVSSGTPLNNMAWLSMYLSHQNGSIYQAIKMWANAVQKKVESTPVCYVCYCRLHPTTGQLPKMFCQTCKNKFHNACLHRWFSTSGKTTCPMCRNVFNV